MLFVLAASLLPLTARAQEGAKSVSIVTSLSVPATRSRIVKVLLDRGYDVVDTASSILRTRRRTLQHVLQLELVAKLITVDGKTTRVVITGNYIVEMMHEDPIPVVEAEDGSAGEMWDELTAVGDRVRKAVAAAGDAER